MAGELLSKWECWIRAGALVSEMETAALFTVCASLRARAGAVMLCIWNQIREEKGYTDLPVYDTDLAIRVAIEGLKRLIGEDQRKREKKA